MLAEDPELLTRLRAGDNEAFSSIVRDWSPAMLRVAHAHVRTHASAQDAVQEAWIGVLRALDGFEGRAQLRTWVFRILVNVARRRGRQEAQLMVELGGPAVDPDRFRDSDHRYPGYWRAHRVPADWGPEAAVLISEFRDLLGSALAGLPERQRAVVELRDVQGMPATEVCGLLALSPVNQRVLLHRGRTRLRGLLGAAIG